MPWGAAAAWRCMADAYAMACSRMSRSASVWYSIVSVISTLPPEANMFSRGEVTLNHRLNKLYNMRHNL